MSLRLGFDVDGVLADFHSAFEATARGDTFGVKDVQPSDPDQLGSEQLSTRKIRRAWRLVVRSPNWWTRVRPYEPEQIKRLYTLSRRLKWEVFFLTKRPHTAGDSVQFQTQWWLEEHGFYMPAVLTVPGSRGELANSLRLDIVVDDQLVNCADIIATSPASTLLLLRDPGDKQLGGLAKSRGIGVVHTLEEALDAIEELYRTVQARRGVLVRLKDVLPKRHYEALPDNPRVAHPPSEPESGS